MTKIVMHLPFPPSVNAVWRSNRGRVHKSSAYISWQAVAGQEWMTQKIKQPRFLPGDFSLILVLVNPDRRRRDLDNRLKACLDFCKLHRVIQDDSLARKIYLRWGTKKEAPLGARLILRG